MSQDVSLWVRELQEAGWKAIRFDVWKAPHGALYRGPYGAWKAMNILRASLLDPPPEQDTRTSPRCWCHKCNPQGGFAARMILCPDCGNKRCPKASDHELACTNSNEPGQLGSVYA